MLIYTNYVIIKQESYCDVFVDRIFKTIKNKYEDLDNGMEGLSIY